ncbi:MAG: SDR family NAD(P)-dependent oxidoreductase [Anaerolineales bacterium]|jgi:short-subunit dehydrogenase|nr:SDR family NAD(P)-dependent oxidoreductase [Anaerolineales bacterium]MCW5839543.1 SDR family NAD(P)-dependent oxidoreductase [Anaerolineales bacterium]MCW5888885.1 SDR family NAD(P)-dependent oxidoreductase [Anaerolineales bacterium]
MTTPHASEPALTRRPRAIVVGASSGIGAALVRRLAHEGYLVAALSRSAEPLQALANELNGAGQRRVIAHAHDVTHLAEIPTTLQKLLAEMGGLDLFVYCAGVMPAVEINEFDLEKDQHMLAVNLSGGVAWLGQVAALFQKQGSGHIVGISSVAGDRGRVLNPAYNASKAGLDTYLEALRNRLSRHGITVLTVRPGFVDTQILANAPRSFGVISPQQCATGIWHAIRRRQQTVYVPGWWRWLMLAVRNVPSFIFRRLSF